MSNVKTKIRSCLLAGIAKQAGVDALIAELENKRAGMYTHGVLAAIAAKGDAEAFAEVCETLKADFRSNRRGIAEKYNCDVAKDKAGNLKTDDSGNPIYKVPSSLSSMASHIKTGFANNVDFGTAKKPTAFSAIRTLNQTAKEAAEKAAATPEDQARAAIREIWEAIEVQLTDLNEAQLVTVAKLMQSVGEAVAKAA